MPKNNTDRRGHDEKELLQELLRNARENINTNSKNCGFSRQKTWKMIKELEEKQLIWG